MRYFKVSAQVLKYLKILLATCNKELIATLKNFTKFISKELINLIQFLNF